MSIENIKIEKLSIEELKELQCKIKKQDYTKMKQLIYIPHKKE